MTLRYHRNDPPGQREPGGGTNLEKTIEFCRMYHRGVCSLLPATIALTEREGEILEMLSGGMKHDKIAQILYISVSTVRYHVKNLYRKLGVDNKVAAIQKAKELNLL